ncbi:hypothetical protein, partial [Christiangramia aquimixticola]|uniref:hypothetical protein n=1 Tax=Christiangramia aquimixticola TaxID=1697558 RepID=UPI003AA96AEF
QWLFIILLVPLLMLTLDYFLKLGIPVFFIFTMILGFFGLLIFIRVEEKRLIENFHRFIQLNLHSVVNKLD